MRSLLIAILALGAVTGVQAKDYGPAGCGLGTEVIFKDANEWHEHVLAATTNGTSGCAAEGTIPHPPVRHTANPLDFYEFDQLNDIKTEEEE